MGNKANNNEWNKNESDKTIAFRLLTHKNEQKPLFLLYLHEYFKHTKAFFHVERKKNQQNNRGKKNTRHTHKIVVFSG